MKYLHVLAFTIIAFQGLSQATKISVTDAKSDLEFVHKTIESVHYNSYSNISKEAYLKEQQRIFNSWGSDSITIKEFTRCGMKLTSVLGMGHTSFDWQNPGIFPELSAYGFIPIKTTLLNDHLIVTASNTDQLKVGDTIQTINGLPGNDVFREIMSYTGGVEAFKTTVSEMLFPLYLFFNSDIDDNYKLTLQSGEHINISEKLNMNEVFEFIQSNNSQQDYTFEKLENNIGLISYNSCNNYYVFEQFLDSTFAIIRSQKIKRLVIDLRYNPGGNSSLNDLLLSYLTRKKYRQFSGRYWKISSEVQAQVKYDSLWYGFVEDEFLTEYLNAENQSIIDGRDLSLIKNKKPKNYFKGEHCFLIGAYTFSSANFLADAVKTYNLSTLIGKDTGELTNDFGEQVEFQLARSKSYFFVPTTYDIGAENDLDAQKTVTPDHIVNGDALSFAITWLMNQ